MCRPHTDAQSVIVTGTFDNVCFFVLRLSIWPPIADADACQWSCSVHLQQKAESGFTGSVAVPWDSKIIYKFIVDGNWVTHPSQPTETDASGFVNNVVHTPVKPEPAVAASEEPKKEVAEKVCSTLLYYDLYV